jgi:hypothetical protein
MANEGSAATDDGHPRALADKAKQQQVIDFTEGKDQSARRLSADRDPDPGVLLTLQVLFVTIEMRHTPSSAGFTTCRHPTKPISSC